MSTHQQLLAKIDAKVEAIIDGGFFQSHSLAGHDSTRYSLADIIALRKHYRSLSLSSSGGLARNLAHLNGG